MTKTCPVCSTTFAVKPSHAGKRVYCSKLCQGAALSIAWRGENNPGWTGGYEPYYGPSWRPAMRAVRKRDKVCRRCEVSPKELGRALDVHHLTPFKAFGVARHLEANDISNLIALCNTCHLAVEWETNRRSLHAALTPASP
jgi:5-methylcytosine-specific restriction endonuclease McrA